MPRLQLPDLPAIELQPDETLLQALHRAGIVWREACQLQSGSVHYGTRKPHGLTAQEQQQGLILPCIALPASDQLSLSSPSYPARHTDLSAL